MRTIYLRNVPDEVVERLESMARAERMSVSALAVRELAQASLRAGNARLLNDLPVLEVDRADVLRSLEDGRAGR